MLSLFVWFEGFLVLVVTLAGPRLAPWVSWWSVLVGNLLAGAVILGYFFARQRDLPARMRRHLREGPMTVNFPAYPVWFFTCSRGRLV